MAYVPMNRTRALIICTYPQDYLPGRLREAARYLLDRKDATDEERRLATEAIELLRAKRGETPAPETEQVPEPTRPPARQTSPVTRLIRLDTWPNTLRAYYRGASLTFSSFPTCQGRLGFPPVPALSFLRG